MLSKLFGFFGFLWRYLNRKNFRREDFEISEMRNIRQAYQVVKNVKNCRPYLDDKTFNAHLNLAIENSKKCNILFSNSMNTDKNNLGPFKSYFDTFMNPTNIESLQVSVNRKPLLVYALDRNTDHNGLIISDNGLETSKTRIKKFEEDFTVVPILFNGKNELDDKINDIKDKLNIKDVGVLWLRGHGNNTRFTDFYTATPDFLK